MSEIQNVLFLCTGNSARSIFAEAILQRFAGNRFKAFSAGSQPRGEVHPRAAEFLKALNYDLSQFRSKDWNEFTQPGAPEMHFVFTVCDSAASETCPVWPGQPISAHWGVSDPAAVEDGDAEAAVAFAEAYRVLYHRITAFASLPLGALDMLALRKSLDEIGRSGGGKAESAAE